MIKIKLTQKQFKEIKEKASAEFINAPIKYKQKYEEFLVECVIKSFLNFLKSNNISVVEGELIHEQKD